MRASLPYFEILRALLCFAVVTLCMVFADRASAAPPGGKRVVGYFAEWTGYSAADIPAELLTHINYSFCLIKNGEIAFDDARRAIGTTDAPPADPSKVGGHFGDLRLLKQKHPHLKTLISVGGWGGSAHFSDTALTAASREKFARSCASFASRYGFDGIDIDWEYPGGGGANPESGRPQDKENFTLLLQQLRSCLDEQGKTDGRKYLLTIATPASPSHCKCIELDRAAKIVDFINLMTYDFTGTWSEITSFNAPLFGPPAGVADPAGRPALSADSAVHFYLAGGVPAEKLVLGVPFFGQAFAGVKNVNHGLFQPHSGKAPEAPGGSDWGYRKIVAQFLAKPAPPRFWDELSRVPWLYFEKTGIMISYDDADSLRLKAEYARQNGLGGVMIWELSHDDRDAPLLKALNAGLAGK